MVDVVLTADLPASSSSSEKLQKNPEESNQKSTEEKVNGSPETENQTAGEKETKTIEESKIQEDLKESEDPQKPQDEEEVLGPNDVTCDSCIDRPCRATKSCLTCLVSYCEAHLRPHLENVKFQSHRLVEPLRDIERRTCETHRCALELFCCADACCVCQECVTEDHRGHSAVPITEARKKIEETSFQVVLISGGDFSFILMNYGDIAVTGHPVQAGYDTINSTHYFVIPGSINGSFISNLRNSSNVDVPGRWVFRVDGGPGNSILNYNFVGLRVRLSSFLDLTQISTEIVLQQIKQELVKYGLPNNIELKLRKLQKIKP